MCARRGSPCSLFAGNKLHIAVVTDFADGEKKKVREIRKSQLLRDGHVLTMDSYTNQAEADVEDLVGREMYIELVARAYDLSAKHRLPKQRPDEAPIRAVKEAEDHFRTLPPEIKEFSHYGPAEELLRSSIETEIPGLEAAIDRFEKLFTDLNEMLS